MKFSETIKHTGPDLVVSKRHEQWLADNDHPTYSTLAVSFATKTFTGRDRERKGTVSASSLGECQRAQQFEFLGMPKLPPSAQSVMRMHNGAMMHLRWQMEGLTEGWLKDAEVPVYQEALGLRGTMDGIAYEGSIVELKSINSNGFRRVQSYGPLTPHLFQMATYMLCTGRKKGSFIYECKDNQEYQEFVVGPHDVPLVEARYRARDLWAEIDGRRLVEPLTKCLDQEGWVYQYCPFRDRCLQIHDWGEVG